MTAQLFVQQRDDGTVDAGVVKKRAIQCALSRICGSCGKSLTWPVAFVGSAEEAAALLFAFPPLHPSCAEELLRDAPGEQVLVRTGGFELVRPTRRGDPVSFRPNSVIEDD
jgi:hypothetical protein